MTDRPHGIGGSDAAAAVGLDPYRSPVALWLEKTGRVEPRPESEAMAWGKRLQPVLAQVALDDDPEMVERLRRARAAVEVAKAEREEAETAIKARLGEAGTGTLHGARVVTWKSQTAKRVDVKRLPAEVRAEFEYEASSRVFRVFA